MSYRLLDNERTVYAICERCGIDWTFSSRYFYRASFNKELCWDCRLAPLKKVTYPSGRDSCTPWRGDFDDNDNPMKDGKLYKPGARTCGHRDCTRGSHIIGSDTATSD